MTRTVLCHTALLLMISTATLGAQQEPWPPPNYLRPAVRGQIRDSSTGRAGGRFSYSVEGEIGLSFGWLDGRYLLFDLRPGTRVVNFYCPTTRRLRGRKIAERVVEVAATTDSVVDFTFDTRGCREPPLRSWDGEFRGHYIPGFESSVFEPCTPLADLRETTYQDDRQVAWVGFEARAVEHVKWPDTGDERYPRLYVRWRATVTGPGSYGHLGYGMYGMVVHEALEVRREREGDCR